MFYVFGIVFIALVCMATGEIRLSDDKKTDCKYWAKQGYCTSKKYKEFMAINCKKSCGVCSVCTQTNRNCRAWALRGECTKNQKWMVQNCPISCGVCGDCIDKLAGNQCYMQKLTGQCRENKRYMSAWCACSCGVCTPKEKTGRCPSSHPWAYGNGEYCCASDREKRNFMQGSKCDGSKISRTSLCCKDNAFRKCPHKGGCVNGAPEATKKPVVITKPKPATTRKPKPKTNAPKLRLEIPVNEDMCGKRIAKGRVVGGYADSRDNWPWIALLVKASSTEKVWCGASILNAKFALTAAHCLSSYRATEAKDWKLRVGMSDLTKKHASEKLVSIRKITLGKWDANTYDNDIALLELEDLLFLNRRIKPICLPSQGEQFPLSSQCFVAGWGRLSDGGDVAKVLMAAKIPLIDENECRRTMHKPPDVITKNMFCGGYKKGGIDACQGDSGGPLICKVGRRFVQAGIVSWGKECAKKGVYGVYTRLSNYRDWIERAMMT